MGAAESLFRAHRFITRYPWLSDWAQPRLKAKIAYAEELGAGFAATIVPGNLVDAAAVALLLQPELPFDRTEFAVLGDARRALATLWRRWREEASSRWTRLEERTSAQYSAIHEAMGNRRKGRPEAEQALHDLIHEWITSARALSSESATLADRWLIVSIPRPENRHARMAEVQLLPHWHLGVLAAHTVAIDWSRRIALLKVPDLVGRVLLD